MSVLVDLGGLVIQFVSRSSNPPSCARSPASMCHTPFSGQSARFDRSRPLRFHSRLFPPSLASPFYLCPASILGRRPPTPKKMFLINLDEHVVRGEVNSAISWDV